MHLVQILLPLFGADGSPIADALFRRVKDELTERFGGLTAYTRAPAEGRWQSDADDTERDEIVVFEVMTADIDRGWWDSYRRSLETSFRQKEVVIRAQQMERL